MRTRNRRPVNRFRPVLDGLPLRVTPSDVFTFPVDYDYDGMEHSGDPDSNDPALVATGPISEEDLILYYPDSSPEAMTDPTGAMLN